MLSPLEFAGALALVLLGVAVLGIIGGIVADDWLTLRDLRRAHLDREHVNPPPGCGCVYCTARRDPRNRHLLP